MFNISFCERMLIFVACAILISLICAIIAIFSIQMQDRYFTTVIGASAGGFLYQIIDFSIFKFRNRKNVDNIK